MSYPQWNMGIQIAALSMYLPPQNIQAAGRPAPSQAAQSLPCAHALPLRMPEEQLCRELSRYGEELGLNVYVFSPLDYDEERGVLQGYRLADGSWQRMPCPLPDIVYDRCFYTSRMQRLRGKAALKIMSERQPLIRLGSELPGKLAVFQALRNEPRLAALLPRSMPYRGGGQLLRWLEREPHGVVLKPDGGMQGRGIMRLWREADGLHIQGRSPTNEPYSCTLHRPQRRLPDFQRSLAGGSYLIQPYLRLNDREQRPFDIRVLVQKDQAGHWAVTGSAVRLGQAGTLTANLHGGGGAEEAVPFLERLLGSREQAERLMKRLHAASLTAARTLEGSFGRLLELGLDFGLEPDGSLWLLEANSKPGRSLFRLLGDQHTARLAQLRPLQYARLLCSRFSPCLAHDDEANKNLQQA